MRRSSSGELPSIGNVSSRFERNDAAGVTTSRSSLTTRTASWPARQTTMPRSSGTSSTPRNSVGQSSVAPSLASSSRPVRESARTWPVSPVMPGTPFERLDAEAREVGRHACSRCPRRQCASSATSTARRSPRGASANHDSSRRDSGNGAKNGVRSSSRRKLLRSAKRSMPSASRSTSISTVAASGQARPARVTPTSRSANRQVSPVRCQSPDNAMRSNRESTAPSELCSSDVGERELGGAAREHAALPLEPDRHVAAARLRRDGGRRKQARRDGEIHVVDVGRQAPIARELARRQLLRRRRTPAP